MTSGELFRKEAEAVDGMPISAGARTFHVRNAVEKGRACYVDLTGVPEDRRAALIAEIVELVRRASTADNARAAAADPAKTA